MLESLKRALFFVHRWAGILLGLLIVLWFVSGVVTMYVGYPKLTPAERLARLPVLLPDSCCISFEAAWRGVAEDSLPRSALLTSIADRPVYKFERSNDLIAVDAVTGSVIERITPERAVEAARAFLPGYAGTHAGVVTEDMWTRGSALHPHRPLHKIEMSDPDYTRLYVSSVTGEVVLDSTRSQRRWNLIGPWLHWLHALRGPSMTRDDWRVVIIGLTLAALVLTISGIISGVMRWRFRGTYPSGKRTPYRQKYMRWHHITGMIFAAVSVTWIFSGMMSVNPWGVFGNGHAMHSEHATTHESWPEQPGLNTQRVLAELQPLMRVSELEWHRIDGEPYLVARDASGQTSIKRASGEVIGQFSTQELTDAAAKLFPAAAIKQTDELTAYDRYYYQRASHTLRGHHDRRLPVVRVQFDDPDETWVYMSPYTGTSVMQLDSRQRVERWLFWFLHSWDARALLAARPLWDVVMLLLCMGGLALGLTGVVIGFRRLRSKLEAYRMRMPPVS